MSISTRARVWMTCVLLLLPVSASLAAVSLPFKLVPAFIAMEPMPLTASEQQWLAAHRPLKVGISIDDYQPIDITRDRNRYQGISADYLSLIGARLNAPMQVLGFSERAQAVEALRTGAIDILTSANARCWFTSLPDDPIKTIKRTFLRHNQSLRIEAAAVETIVPELLSGDRDGKYQPIARRSTEPLSGDIDHRRCAGRMPGDR